MEARLENILNVIKSQYSKSFNIDYGDLHFEVEPLTSVEDVKVMEACKTQEGAQYLEALKRHTLAYGIKQVNDMNLRAEDIEYEKDGKKMLKSKYLFMVDYIAKFPSALVESLFNSFVDMQTGVEDRVKKDAKFEHFVLSEQPDGDTPDKFRKLSDTDVPSSELTDVEKLNRKVADEISQKSSNISQTEEEYPDDKG